MFLCLLISVIKYLIGLILRASFPGAGVIKDYRLQPTVSVLLPCYNEGKTVYETIESISRSNYPVSCSKSSRRTIAPPTTAISGCSRRSRTSRTSASAPAATP